TPGIGECNRIVDRQVVLEMVLVAQMKLFSEVRALAEQREPRARCEWLIRLPGDRVDDKRVAPPMPHRVAQPRQPELILCWMVASVGIDMPRLAIFEDQNRLLRQHRDLEHPGRLHQAWETARTDLEG